MSEPVDKQCADQNSHHLHLCQLKKKGLTEEVAARTSDPGYVCHNCNITANRAEDLCNGSPFVKRA